MATDLSLVVVVVALPGIGQGQAGVDLQGLISGMTATAQPSAPAISRNAPIAP